MIRINKECAPEKLNEGTDKSREDCADYEENKNDYETGTRKLSFWREIYAHNEVKSALRRSHHEKCCYCEGKFAANAWGDVEHYRPKGAVRQDKYSSRIIPGYFWLAYTWDNLYWCCQVCNRNYKKELFPLRNPERRARSPTDSLDDERPLILDPGGPTDPREHIKFIGAKAVGCTEVGKKTVEVINLNRSLLFEKRLERFRVIKTLCETKFINKNSQNEDDLQDTISLLDDYAKPCAEFSAMTNDYLKSL